MPAETLHMGPVLRLQDRTGDIWHVTALIVTSASEPTLRYQEQGSGQWHTVEPKRLMTHGEQRVLRYSLDIQLAATDEKVISYTLEGHSAQWSFCVPSLESARLRAAFVSCNGFSSSKERRDAKVPFERWEDLVEQHKTAEEGQFHVLMMGGDQVYADPIWDKKPAIEKWTQKEGDNKWHRSGFNKEMERQAQDFFFDLYVRSWGEHSRAMRQALSSIPTVMMWDDHDIFDGWGSYEDEKLDSDVYQGIYGVARRHFQIFQLHRLPGEHWDNHLCSTDNMSYAVTLDDVAIVALDLRSERRRDRVIAPESWEQIYSWIDGQSGLSHMLIISSVPVVHVNLSALEWVTGVFDPADLDDDLRDHWLSRAHKQERLRLIHRLFSFSSAASTRVTLLSGDIHVAALGVLEKEHDEDTGERGGSIYQIISSPVVHPTPPATMRWFYDWMAQDTEEVCGGITSRFMKMPASDIRYIGERNWVALEVDRSKRRLWCNWRVEGDDTPYRHALNARQ
jgi:hypothetical protein